MANTDVVIDTSAIIIASSWLEVSAQRVYDKRVPFVGTSKASGQWNRAYSFNKGSTGAKSGDYIHDGVAFRRAEGLVPTWGN